MTTLHLTQTYVPNLKQTFTNIVNPQVIHNYCEHSQMQPAILYDLDLAALTRLLCKK